MKDSRSFHHTRENGAQEAGICVVHLVRKTNGIEPFRRFLESYLKFPAGIDHELVILYKGFKAKDLSSYRNLLEGVPHSSIMIADIGFDLRAYFTAVEKVCCRYLCFINSFSVVLDGDWLFKFYRHITRPGIGLVGATASWGSIRPGPITRKKNPALWLKVVRPFLWRMLRAYVGFYFDEFPNYHVRTNGFMIARDTMSRIRRGLLLTKMQTYRLESGKNSLTKQVERMGLRPLVVGRDGIGYEKEEWHTSHTFWCEGQKNLLIADNQTKTYELDDADGRQRLERFAWGEKTA
jgi:hypothetical protein